ncbi:MAG: hypothetical protein AAF547_00810 [Actinomycetota bacterium]
MPEPSTTETDQRIERVVDPAIEATAVPILEYGRAWMMAPQTAARAAEIGLDGPLGFWVNGRAGVLGEVDADVAAAAIGFMAPDLVGRFWRHRPDDLTPMTCASRYAEAAAVWGRTALADVDPDQLETLADLANRVAESALPSTGVLFAGWRNLPQPVDPAGRVTVALNVLRELRGGAHLAAVHAVGLGPHRAVLAAPDPVRGGVAGAERFGWPAPHPAADVDRRVEAEHRTTVACRHAYAALDDAELATFTRLVLAVRAAID